MVRVSVGLEDKEVKELFQNLKKKLGNLTPVMKSVGETIRTSVVKNFEVGGRPRWKPSHRAVMEHGQTLVRTGRLRNSISVKAFPDRALVGTNVKYAAIHQFGGKTGATVIRPKNKKALFWPGARHPVKMVRHPGSNIPARPFLLVQDEDWQEIVRIMWKHLEVGS